MKGGIILEKTGLICYDKPYINSLFINAIGGGNDSGSTDQKVGGLRKISCCSFMFDWKESEVFHLTQLCQATVEYLKKAYASYYDIETIDDGTELKAVCAYHSRDSRYVLVKSAELWAAESHEYIYLWGVDCLDVGRVEEIFRRSLEDGEPRVKPHAQHMSTYITAVVLYESAAPEALDRLKKLKKRREFKLSLHGWMEFRIAAVDLSTAGVTVNRAGKSLAKDLERMVGHAISAYCQGEEKTQ